MIASLANVRWKLPQTTLVLPVFKLPWTMTATPLLRRATFVMPAPEATLDLTVVDVITVTLVTPWKLGTFVSLAIATEMETFTCLTGAIASRVNAWNVWETLEEIIAKTVWKAFSVIPYQVNAKPVTAMFMARWVQHVKLLRASANVGTSTLAVLAPNAKMDSATSLLVVANVIAIALDPC